MPEGQLNIHMYTDKHIRTKNALESNPKSAKSFELPLTTSYDRPRFPIYFPFSPDKGIFPTIAYISVSVNRFLPFHLQQSLSLLPHFPPLSPKRKAVALILNRNP